MKSRPCSVCLSPNRKDYEKQREQGMSLRDLEEYAKGSGESISHGTFHTHFKEEHNDEDREKMLDDYLLGLSSLALMIKSKAKIIRCASNLTEDKEMKREIRELEHYLDNTEATLDAILKE